MPIIAVLISSQIIIVAISDIHKELSVLGRIRKMPRSVTKDMVKLRVIGR